MAEIVIQRGHVPRTTGATGAPGEQAFTTEAAERTRVRVSALGHRARVIDADVPDSSYRGDMFFAIHYDSSTSSAPRGASVGYQTPEGSAVGRSFKAHYSQNGWTGGYRSDNYTRALGGYYGVRNAVEVGNRRAIIIEAGFHSNPQDALLLASPHGPDRVAIAIAGCVVDHMGARCPQPLESGPLPPFPGTVGLGDRGPAVRAWQHELNARVYGGGPHALAEDGVFGPATENIVADFQDKRGLTVDGIAGPRTWHALVLG